MDNHLLSIAKQFATDEDDIQDICVRLIENEQSTAPIDAYDAARDEAARLKRRRSKEFAVPEFVIDAKSVEIPDIESEMQSEKTNEMIYAGVCVLLITYEIIRILFL